MQQLILHLDPTSPPSPALNTHKHSRTLTLTLSSSTLGGFVQVLTSECEGLIEDLPRLNKTIADHRADFQVATAKKERLLQTLAEVCPAACDSSPDSPQDRE